MNRSSSPIQVYSVGGEGQTENKKDKNQDPLEKRQFKRWVWSVM